VFPFIRAVWERMPRPIGQPLLPGGRPLRIKDLRGMGYFQGHFWKVMTVLDHVAADEATLLAGAREGSSVDEYAPYLSAHDTLPIWLDIFYVYFRILANRLGADLGFLTSEQPGGWPKSNFRDLVNADVDKLRRWKARDAEALAQALKANRRWFDQLTSEGHKGARDAIVKVLARPVISIRTGDDGVRSVVVWRETPKGYEERDLLALVPEVLAGFCSMLSAFPAGLWNRQRFEARDFIESDGSWTAVERFFPLIETEAP
jgi:hypothetical protein